MTRALTTGTFERTDRKLGRFSLRPVELDADARMLHGWLTHPKAEFWPTLGPDVEDISTQYREIDESPWHEAFVGALEGEPAFLVERYHPAHDELGDAYEVLEGDIGMHFLLAPTDRPIHGFSHAVIATVMAFMFSDPAVRRVVVEPDVRNGAVHALNAAVGFREVEVIAVSGKDALLSTCTREQYQAALEADQRVLEDAR